LSVLVLFHSYFTKPAHVILYAKNLLIKAAQSVKEYHFHIKTLVLINRDESISRGTTLIPCTAGLSKALTQLTANLFTAATPRTASFIKHRKLAPTVSSLKAVP